MDTPPRKVSSASSRSDESDISSPGCLISPRDRFGSLPFVDETDVGTTTTSESKFQFPIDECSPTVESCLENLKETLQKYGNYRNELKVSYDNTLNHVDKLFEFLGKDDKFPERLKDRMTEDMSPVEAFVSKDPVILVSGQINCGKSSLVNEILQRTCVPVERTPCTAMITRLKYSKTEYYQVFKQDGSPTERRDFNAKALKKDMKLDSRTRETEAVLCTVEIGLDNPLLECGIQICDTPGTNENKELDDVVKNALSGVLQVLIYVIDGNKSLTRQDEDFIETITSNYPDMNILYVCNKCEDSKKCQKMDSVDSDGKDSDSKRAAASTRKLSKGVEVYEKLKKVSCKAIEMDTTYFKISCKKLRLCRSKQKSPNEFAEQFHLLINALIHKFDECVYGSLNTALASLYALATRSFDYFVSVKFLNQPMWESLVQKLKDVKEKEERAYTELHKLIEDQCARMNTHLKKSIRARKEVIVRAINKRTFGTSLESLDTVVPPSKVQREELAAVFQRVIYEEIINDQAFHEIRSFTEGEIITKIQTLMVECERLPGVGDLIPQLKSCFRFELLSNSAVDFCQNMYKKSLSFTLRAILDKILRHFNPRANDRRQESLRQAVVRRFLERIDEKALGSEIARQLFAQLSESHNQFMSIVETIEQAHSTRKMKQPGLMQFVPPFSKDICTLKALIAEVKTLYDKTGVLAHPDVKSGHRNEVYIFGCAPRQRVQRRIKKDGARYNEDFQELAVLLNCGRMLQISHDHIVTSFDLERDGDGCIRVTLPFCQSNLFYGLYHKMNIPLETRMLMARGIVDACSYLAERGFRANDLRPSNILLQQWQPKIDLCKWKSLDTPYPEPDGKPPFHFSPEAISSEDLNREQPGTYDTYSCVILIWMLYIGKFIRPCFAQTVSADEVQCVVRSNISRVREDLLNELQTLAGRQSNMEMLGLASLVGRNIIKESEQRMTIDELLDFVKEVYQKCE